MVLDEDWNRLANIQVALWCHHTGQYFTSVTDANGFCQFMDLDPDLKYDLAVNAEIQARVGDTSIWQRLNANYPMTALYDIELADSGDGWFTLDIRLFEK